MLVPLVIHLINLRRPRKLSFPTLAFFEQLKKSTIRRIRIKQFLLLALRIAAIIMLALALARPLLSPSLGGAAETNEPKLTALLIDNSPSMSRIGADGPFIDQARHIAGRIVEGSSDEDRFLVTGTNAISSGSGTQLVNRERALDLIGEMEVSNSGNRIAESVRMIVNRLNTSSMQQAMIYLVTDAQQSQLDDLKELDGPDPGSDSDPDSDDAGQTGLEIITVGSSMQPNIAVSGLELRTRMLSSGNPVTLQAEVRNFGNAEAANQFVSLEFDDRMVGQYEVNLGAGETRQLSFEVVPQTVGDIAGKVVIEGDEVDFDNAYHFVISIPETRSVLLVSEEKHGSSEFVSYLQPALEAARRSNTQITFNRRPPDEVDQSNWLQHDVIILDGLRQVPEYWFEDLQRYVQGGRGLLFFPSEQGDIRNYNSFMGLFNAGRFTGIQGEYASFKPVARLDDLVEGHPILEEMFVKENEDDEIRVTLPELFFYYLFESGTGTGSYPILTSTTGDEILVEQRFGEGRMLISTLGTDPGWSNFPVNALFAPIYYRSVLYASASEQGGLTGHELGDPFVWTGALGNSDQEVELRLGEVTYRAEVQTVPQGIMLRYSGNGWGPGVLHIIAGDSERLVAVNQDIMESDFETLQTDELENYLDNSVTITGVLNASELSEDDLVSQLRSASMGKEVWSWFIWAALLLLVAETLVSKLFRAESLS